MVRSEEVQMSVYQVDSNELAFKYHFEVNIMEIFYWKPGLKIKTRN